MEKHRMGQKNTNFEANKIDWIPVPFLAESGSVAHLAVAQVA